MAVKRLTLSDYEGQYISFMYNGSDLPNGQIGPQELTGKLTRAGKHSSDLETKDNKKIELLSSDIDTSSIRILTLSG